MENIDSFYTLMGEASSLTKEAKYDEALIAYDNILDKYLDTKDESIIEYLPYTFYNKALIYAHKRV